MTRLICLALLLCPVFSAAQQRDILLTGGWLFSATGDERVANPGILLRAGKILQLGGDLTAAAVNPQLVALSGDETVIPGMFDLHAHYAIDLYGRGRTDDTTAYPAMFLANGVTSTFPAGEMQPEKMRALRLHIDNGERPGPRIFNSGPYFGTARPGWRNSITPEEIHAEVDHWVEQGAKAFKAKGITPAALKPLIERAHFHGLTVTGHLDSGARNSVNPFDAISMGIDRIEHFMGGAAIPPTRSAYASLENLEFPNEDMDRTFAHYIAHGVYFDATMSAYGYYGKRDPQVFAYFTDEKRFLTPYMRAIVDARPPRAVNEQFEKIYWVKRKELKAFYDAGGGHLITLGTDHPSWGEFFSPFSVHRELHSFVLSGIPAAAALRIATINGARALGVGDRLGTIEVGKWADMVVLRDNPLADIRATREARLVIKGGQLYDPAELLKSAEGKLGPGSEAEAAAWGAPGGGGS